MTLTAMPPQAVVSVGVEAASVWLRGWKRGTRFAVCHSDEVDGIASAALVLRFLERCGHAASDVLAPGKGARADDAILEERLGRSRPDAIILLALPPSFAPGVPILIVDDDRIAVGMTPIDFGPPLARDTQTPTTSLTTYRILAPLADLSDVSWYATLGVIAERGASASFPEYTDAKKRWGQKNLAETVALLSAGNRASAHDIASALAALMNAGTPADIANGMIAEYDILDEYRTEMQSERSRCAKISPLFAGEWAVLLFSSACQIEVPLAASWVGRLPKHIIVSANEGYMPAVVYFSIRTRRDASGITARLQSIGGIELLPARDLSAPDAIHGTASKGDFLRFLSNIGLSIG